jgi:hypothetical protein
MTLRLVYSRTHECHNKPMVWQPAAYAWYCQVCHRKEAPNEYAYCNSVPATIRAH